MPNFGLHPVIVEDAFRPMDAAVKPWTIEQAGLRKRKSRGVGIKVGVVDTGRPDHADLREAIVDAKDFTRSPSGDKDINGHSTHVCGTIAGREWDDEGVGVAPGVKLYCAKVLGDNGSGSDDAVAAGVDWCIECGCDIINLSLGSPVPMPATSAAIGRAVAKGIPVVTASGNGGDRARSWPAMDERVISVAAVDSNKNPAAFSEPSSVDVAAGGVRILSTYTSGRYYVLSGTSMAAPFFAGCLAIYFADLRDAGQKRPAPHELFDLIDQWTEDVGVPGEDAKTGPGLISPAKYEKSREANAPQPPAETWKPWLKLTDNLALFATRG